MISNTELDQAVRIMGIRNYQGTFSKDELARLPRRVGCMIVNLEDSTDKRGRPLPGTHWVLLDVRARDAVYIDPFGVIPPPVMIKYAGRPLHYSVKQVEALNSSLCGYICLYNLYQHQKGRPYSDVLGDFATFPHTSHNRDVIDDFFGIRSR